MFKNPAITLITLLLLVLCASTTSAQSSTSETAKTKARITKLGVGSDVTVSQHVGKTFHGGISQIGADSFTVNEVDLKANVEIRYDQVKHLEKGYTQGSPITGHRPSPKTQRIFRFAALGALVVVIAIVVAALRDPNF